MALALVLGTFLGAAGQGVGVSPNTLASKVGNPFVTKSGLTLTKKAA
jgi:hypothetical protein